jgi:hypothetical protein
MTLITPLRRTIWHWLQRFFTEHLAAQRNLSGHTITAYRDAFRLLLTFLSAQRREPVDRLTLEALSPERILGFLDHLERTRRNGIRTRNVRLAALRAFTRFAVSQTTPDVFPHAQRLLAIPLKRAPKPEWHVSLLSGAAEAGAVAEVAVAVARAIEATVGLGAAFDHAGFAAVGSQRLVRPDGSPKPGS